MIPPEGHSLIAEIIPSLMGWCTVDKAVELAELANSCEPPVSAEIGIFGGRSLIAMAIGGRSRPGAQTWGCDPWDRDAALQGTNHPDNDEWWSALDYEQVYNSFVQAVLHHDLTAQCRWVRCTSAQMAAMFSESSVGLLHIDGNHSEEMSVADVETWWPKVAVGGYIVMDDTNWLSTQRATALLTLRSELVADRGDYAVFRKISAGPDVSEAHRDVRSTSSDLAVPTYIGGGRCIVRLDFATLCFHGTNIDVSPFFWRDGVYEAETSAVLDALIGPGDTFINVGANYGYHALRQCQRLGHLGKVIAVEANPEVFDCLVRGAFYSQMTHETELFHAAVGAVTGERRTLIANPMFAGGGGLIADHAPTDDLIVTAANDAGFGHRCYVDQLGRLTFRRAQFQQFEVDTVTLDDVWRAVGEPSVGALLMDIEGGEYEALCGATDLLAANPRMSMVVEIAPLQPTNARTTAAHPQAMDLLERHGFAAYRIDPTAAGPPTLVAVDLRADAGVLRHANYLLCPADAILPWPVS